MRLIATECSIFWTALFGVFANMWLKEDCEGNKGCERMKVAMWFDLVGMLLMLLSAVGESELSTSTALSYCSNTIHYRRSILVAPRPTWPFLLHRPLCCRLSNTIEIS